MPGVSCRRLVRMEGPEGRKNIDSHWISINHHNCSINHHEITTSPMVSHGFPMVFPWIPLPPRSHCRSGARQTPGLLARFPAAAAGDTGRARAHGLRRWGAEKLGAGTQGKSHGKNHGKMLSKPFFYGKTHVKSKGRSMGICGIVLENMGVSMELLVMVGFLWYLPCG